MSGIIFESDDLISGFDKMSKKVLTAVLMYANTKSKVYESFMKMNRRWTDRTGMAKATLNAKVTTDGVNKVRITLAHGVTYGIWLELANEKRFEIIKTTIDANSADFIEGAKEILNNINV